MKTGIATVHAPKALGPYSQGINTGQLVFTSGQLGLIPETGVLAGPDVESQARQVMKNIQAVLETAGTDFAHAGDHPDFGKLPGLLPGPSKRG